jgi:hypothetical protein
MVIAMGCVGQSSSPAPSSLAPEALESGLYCAAHAGGGPVRLANGRWFHEDAEGKQSVTLTDLRRYGDLDGDGDEDAVILLVSWGGGSGVFYELAAVINDQGQPIHTASVQLGDRVEVESLDLALGRVRVKMIVHDEDDAACCPTLSVERSYLFRGETLTEVSPGA